MRRTVVPYCTSKTALDRLTKGFAIELAEFGIRVNAVEPGFAPGSTASPLTDAHVEATTAGIPMGRASLPEDAPNAIMFVCSEQGRLYHRRDAQRRRRQLDRQPDGLPGQEAPGMMYGMKRRG